MDQKQIFADNLNYLMQRFGKTQIDIISDLGINKSTISTWCNGLKMPRMGTIQTLAEYFGVTKSDLIEEREKQSSNFRSPSDWATPLMVAYQEAKRPTREAVCNVLQIPYINVEDEPEPVTIPTARFDCAAGIPVWVGDGDMEEREYPPGVVPHGTSFAIHIAGDSMTPTIPDGAYVFIRQQPDLRNNEIGVFMRYDEATCKRYYKDKNGVKLISDNPKYDPINIDKDEEGFGLVGKVLGHYLPER